MFISMGNKTATVVGSICSLVASILPVSVPNSADAFIVSTEGKCSIIMSAAGGDYV